MDCQTYSTFALGERKKGQLTSESLNVVPSKAPSNSKGLGPRALPEKLGCSVHHYKRTASGTPAPQKSSKEKAPGYSPEAWTGGLRSQSSSLPP